MVLKCLDKLIGGEPVDPGVIDHGLPDAFIQVDLCVDSAEIDGAGFRGQTRDQSRVVGVHVGYQKIGPGKIDIQGMYSLLHGFETGGTVKPCVDNQVPVVGLDYVRIELFQRTVGQGHFDPVETVHHLIDHELVSFALNAAARLTRSHERNKELPGSQYSTSQGFSIV